ncbi:MAG: LmeA family phospholipid-binding protein [Myxococcota bacterium]
MKKLLLVLLILLVLVIGGVLFADMKVRGLAEEHAEDRITSTLTQAEGVHVTFDGFPFVLGVLATGQVEALHVKIDRVREQGLEAQDLSLDVETISIDTDALIDEQRLVVTDIGAARVQGFIADEQVSKVVGQEVHCTPGAIKAKVEGVEVQATATVKGRTVVLAAPIPGVEPLVFPLPPTDVLPCAPQLEVLEGKFRVSCTVDEIPPRLRAAMAQQ